MNSHTMSSGKYRDDEDDPDVALSNQPVVIDNGTGILKAGFAGETTPKCVFPCFIGRPKHSKVMAGALEGEYFVGSAAEEHRGMMRLKYPMRHGIVDDWGDMEKVWNDLYSNELKIQAGEHPVLLTEAPLNPRKNREKAVEIFFESFNVPAMFVSMQAILSLYASGKTTGVVLDSGDGVTHAVPVYEGFAMPHSIKRIDVAGRDVTEYLCTLLRKSGHALFQTSAEFEVVRTIKETACYVAFSLRKEELEWRDGSTAANRSFTLPDGSVIDLGQEIFRAPELLFNPALIGAEFPGIQHCLAHSIASVDLDLRRVLYSQIVLSGGTTVMAGLGKRLLAEMSTLCPKGIKIKISAPPERKFSTWIGGSILASLGTFKKMWISSQEYKEEGVDVIHRKTF